MRPSSRTRRGSPVHRASAVARIAAAALILGVLVSPSGPPTRASVAPDTVSDHETVFAELGSDGALDRATVVDWLRVTGRGLVHLQDASPGTDPRPLEGSPRPQLEDGNLVWDLQVQGVRDVFVTAKADRPLPVDLRLRFLVDGREVSPLQAQGAPGRVRVEGTLHNRTDPLVPFGAQVSASLPIASFTAIDGGTASAVAVGRSLRLGWFLSPHPDASFAFEVQTTRAKLPSMSMTVVPQAPLGADEQRDAIHQLRDGIEALRRSGLSPLEAGAGRLAAAVPRGLPGGGGPAKILAVRNAVGAAAPQADVMYDARTGRLFVAPHTAQGTPVAAPGGLGALAGVSAGLSQLSAGAGALAAGLQRLDTQGFGALLAALDAEEARLGDPADSQRAASYDTFTGKPPGADGEVRFVYRIAAPAAGKGS